MKFAFLFIPFLCFILSYISFRIGFFNLKNIDKKAPLLKEYLEKQSESSSKLFEDVPFAQFASSIYWKIYSPKHAKGYLKYSAISSIIMGCVSAFVGLMGLLVFIMENS